MRHFICLISACEISMMLCSVAAAQSGLDKIRIDLERTQLQGQHSIAEFRKAIQPYLTPRESQIEASIKYSILPTGAVNAQALRGPNGRTIVVGAGLLQVYEWLSVAVMMPRWGGRDCSIAYINHVIKGVDENGSAPMTARVYEPFTYARRHVEQCRSVSYSAFKNDANAVSTQPAVLGASLGWMLAHELAHQIYEHNFDPKTEPLERSRRNEEEADSFAFRFSSGDPSSLAFTLPAYLVMVGLGGTAEDEPKSSHPTGARRMQVFAAAMRRLPDENPEFRKYLETSGSLERWNQSVDALAEELKSALR